MINGDYILVIAPKDYKGKLYRGKYCYEHHLVYYQYYGVLPKENEIIHHINGNKHDNRIENLQLMNIVEHNKLHRKGITFLLCLCPICNSEFSIRKSQSFLVKKAKVNCCSKDCSYKLDAIRKNNKEKYLSIIEKNYIIKEYKKIYPLNGAINLLVV